MKKRIFATALTLSLMLTLAVPAFAVSANDYSVDVTRKQFLEILANAAGADLKNVQTEVPFSDVPDKNPAIAWAYENWLVCGFADNTFRPDQTITRQEATAILSRYLDLIYTELSPGCGTGMPKMDNIASWARESVSRCWMYGVINSDGGDFRPTEPLSREEAETWCRHAQTVDASAYAHPQELGFADSLVTALSPEGNWMISPYSIRMCLAMVANGATGETQTQLLDALQIKDLDTFNQEIQSLLGRYDGYQRIMTLNTANSLWLNQSQFGGKGAFADGFSKKLGECFRAEAKEVTNRNSVEQVNRWVNDKTNGKIPTILGEDTRKFATALVNAVYFKAAWENTFDAGATKKGTFHNADGTTTQLDFMHQTDYFGYYSTPGIQAVKLDYRQDAVDDETGKNHEFFRDADFSMYLILTEESLDVQNFLDSTQFTNSLVRMSVPKFQLEYASPLDDTLKALGVEEAYSPDSADFTAMLKSGSLPEGENLYLGTVLHKTYLAIDEEGTEAAAVTAAVMDTMALIREPLVREFTADQPFYFAIRDNTSGELLFVGRYETGK